MTQQSTSGPTPGMQTAGQSTFTPAQGQYGGGQPQAGAQTSPPAYNPTDPFGQAATAQGQASQQNVNQQTDANRADQSNPFGDLSWSQDPNTGQWTQNVSLAGAQGDALTAQQNLQAGRSQAASGLLGDATSNLSQGLDTSNLNPLFKYGAPGQTNQSAQDAVMGQLQPILDRNSKALDSQLANQGITMGSEAWKNAHDQEAQDQNNARLQAVQAGFTQGNTENTQNINYANAQQGQNAQDLTQQQTIRNQPLTDINNLTSGQAVTSPTFGAYGQAGVATAPNYLGASQSQYNALLDTSNADAAKQSSLYGGLFGLGSAFLGSSAGSSAMNSAGNYISSLFGYGS